MIRISKVTGRSREQVLGGAVSFFGPEGLGLATSERSDACVSFEGGGGYVTVTACAGTVGCTVEVEAREWESRVKDFLATL